MAAGSEWLIVKDGIGSYRLIKWSASVPRRALTGIIPIKIRGCFGNFSGDNQTDLALLSEDGRVQLLKTKTKRQKLEGARGSRHVRRNTSARFWPQLRLWLRSYIW